MLYVAYLDEFGHIGPYLSHGHHKHATHPVFGLGGIVLPFHSVREFSTYFYQLKNGLLKFEIERDGVHPAKWEKKGSSLYTLQNVTKYRELRKATFRYLNKLRSLQGYIIYVGIEKRRTEDRHNSKNLYHTVLRETIKRLDEQCSAANDQFMLILDQQEENVMRGEIVETASIAMYGNEPRRSLIDPPVQAESHLYQSLQCADWVCGIMGRISHYDAEPDNKKELGIFSKYFRQRIRNIEKRSGIRELKVEPSE